MSGGENPGWPVPGDLTRAYGRSPFLSARVAQALASRVRSRFASLLVAGAIPRPGAGQGVLLYTNHPSWWDPAVFATLQTKLFKDRPGFGPIEARALSTYPFLNRAGFIGLDPEEPASIRRFLQQARSILKRGGVFWITAQGRFADVRERPLAIRPGVAHLAASCRTALIVPVALEYVSGAGSRSEIAVLFGTPLEAGEGLRPSSLTATLEAALEETMDLLAERVVAGEFSGFEAVFGRRDERDDGPGGVYALFRRLITGLASVGRRGHRNAQT